VDVGRLFLGSAEGAAEREVVEPEHVEGRHGRHHEPHQPDELPVATGLEGGPQDLVLGEEAGQGRHAGDGDAAHQHRPVRPGQLRLEAAHHAHVLLAAHGVDDGAGAEKEQGLEEGVSHEVEDAGREGPHPAGQEHVAELAHG
jgi:hypothetical protein